VEIDRNLLFRISRFGFFNRMFNFLGKKEIFAPFFWLIPAIANVQGAFGLSPHPVIYWSIFVITSLGVLMGIGSFTRFVINHLRGPRVPYG